MIRWIAFSVLPGVALCLAGCASLGGNVKSDFFCKAPGGTCSPTSSIDDQAIAVIGDRGARQRTSPAASDVPVADGLRIVLPARLDRFGHWREQSVVYVDRGPMAVPLQAAAGAALPSESARLSLAELAAGAPDLGSVGSRVPRSDGAGAEPEKATDPLAAIREEVEASLDQAPRFVSQPVIQGQTDVPPPPQPSVSPGSDPAGSGDGSEPAGPVASGDIAAPSFPAADGGGE